MDPNAFFGPRLDRTSWILLSVLSIVAGLNYSFRAAISVGIGGILSTINFHWLKQAVDFIILKGAAGGIGRRIGFQYAARYALIGLTLYVTIRFSLLDPIFVM